MALPINIPKLGVSMTEGTLVEWLVADGDEVSEGQPLYVIETDKVENEVEATASGTVRLPLGPMSVSVIWRCRFNVRFTQKRTWLGGLGRLYFERYLPNGGMLSEAG